MQVHILNDYDYDYEVYHKDCGVSWIRGNEPLYEVPDELIKEYEAVNKRRDEIKDQLQLIIRRGPL